MVAQPAGASPQASVFTVAPQQPQLADLLTRRSVPPAPPKASEGGEKKPSAPVVAQESLNAAKDLKGIAALPQTAQGNKTPDSAIKKEDRGFEEGRGERRPSKSEKSGAKGAAGGKAAASRTADGADGETALQAASSGVTSGGGEPVWIADQDPGVQVYTDAKDPLVEVLLRHRWYQKFVAKNPAGGGEVLELVEKAITLDGELEKILKEGLAGRLNVYGGTSA